MTLESTLDDHKTIPNQEDITLRKNLGYAGQAITTMVGATGIVNMMSYDRPLLGLGMIIGAATAYAICSQSLAEATRDQFLRDMHEMQTNPDKYQFD